MTITHLGRARGGGVTLHLDGEFLCVLHGDVALLAGLAVGRELAQEELDELLRDSEFKLARERALRLLSARAYTRRGLFDKLCEKVGEDAAEAAVARMEELGLLDDRDWAERYARDCMQRRGLSERRTLTELMRKGVERELAEEVLAANEQDPEQAIARIVRRRYWNALEDEKGVRRTVNALVRLGYRYEDIRAVLRNLAEDEDYYETE